MYYALVYCCEKSIPFVFGISTDYDSLVKEIEDNDNVDESKDKMKTISTPSIFWSVTYPNKKSEAIISYSIDQNILKRITPLERLHRCWKNEAYVGIFKMVQSETDTINFKEIIDELE